MGSHTNIAPDPWVADLINASPVASVVSNPRLPDNPIIACNDAFVELTGFSPDEIIGRNCRFLRGPRTEPEQTLMLREAIAERRPTMVELINYRKDGTPFWNELSITPVVNESDQLTYYIGIQKDVTEQVEATERVKQLEAEVAELKAELAKLRG